MSNIKPETELERNFGKLLKKAGLRFNTHVGGLPGKPDFVFFGRRLAVFVDGCFWHGCPAHFKFPKTNRPFWKKKIERNLERDRQVNRALKKAGWSVLRMWEHSIEQNPERCVSVITRKLKPAGPTR